MRALRHRQELLEALKNPWARRVIYRIITEGKTFDDPYTGSSDTFYNCGLQATGRRLSREILDASPTTFVQLMDEGKHVLGEEAKAFAEAEKRLTAQLAAKRPGSGTPPASG